jgi:hypothetical protein
MKKLFPAAAGGIPGKSGRALISRRLIPLALIILFSCLALRAQTYVKLSALPSSSPDSVTMLSVQDLSGTTYVNRKLYLKDLASYLGVNNNIAAFFLNPCDFIVSGRDSISINWNSLNNTNTGNNGSINLRAGMIDSALGYTPVAPSDTTAIINYFLALMNNDTTAVLNYILAKLNYYAPLASPAFTGVVSGITPSMVGLGLVTNRSTANDSTNWLNAAAADTLALYNYIIALLNCRQIAGTYLSPSDSTAELNYISALINSDTTAMLNYIKVLINTATAGSGGSVPPGGTSGQVLSKIDNTNYNTQWITLPAGAGTVTGITAGYGLSGGTITSSGTLGVDTSVIPNKTFLSSQYQLKGSYQPAGSYTVPSDTTALINYLLALLNGKQSAGAYIIPSDTTALLNYLQALVNSDTTALLNYINAKLNGLSSGGVSSVTAVSPLASSGGASPSISLSASGVAPGSYINSNITVNSQGLITSASTGTTSGSGNTIVGQLYPTDYSIAGSGANDLVVTRYYCAYTTTVTKLYLGVGASSSSQHIMLAIYNSLNPTTTGDRPNGWPLDSTSGVLMSGNTNQPCIISLASSVTLTAGNYYWFAFLSDNTVNNYEIINSYGVTSLTQYWSQNYSSGFPSISSTGSSYYGAVMAALP